MSNLTIKIMKLNDRKKHTSRGLHAVLILVTLGMWWPIWAYLEATNAIYNKQVDEDIAELEKEMKVEEEKNGKQ